MNATVQVQGIPCDPDDEETGFMLQCSKCGPMGMVPSAEGVHTWAIHHLASHGVDVRPFMEEK